MKIDMALNVRYGGIALLWIGPALVLLAGIGLARAWQIQNWPTTAALVLRNEVDVSQRPVGFSRRGRAANADYFAAHCTYEYDVAGQHYTEMGICAEDFDRDEVERIRRQYAVGTQITIHYWPSHPQDSVLSTKADSLGLSLMFGFGLAAVPAGLVLLKVARKMQPEPAADSLAARPVVRKTPPILTEEKSLRGPSPVLLGAQAERATPTRRLLRGIAICLGLVFLLFGTLLVVTCLGQMARGANAPAAAKVGLGVQIVVTVIFGFGALFGAFLIWLGLRRKASSVPAAAAATVAVQVVSYGSMQPATCPTLSAAEGESEVREERLKRPARERLPSGAGFGNLIAQCGPAKSGQMDSYLWGAALLVFAVLCVLAPGWLIEIKPGDERVATILSWSAAGLSLVFALGIVWTPLLGAPQIIELYENGIVERLGNQVRRIEFDLIEHLQLQEWYEHRFAPRTINVKARVQGQRQLAFSSTLRGEADRIIEYLASQIQETEFVKFDTTL